jgi:hypothetical protein
MDQTMARSHGFDGYVVPVRKNCDGQRLAGMSRQAVAPRIATKPEQDEQGQISKNLCKPTVTRTRVHRNDRDAGSHDPIC